MRFLLLNHIQNAKQSLKSSRARSGLTILGVAIGVASITAILALSGGASKIISDQIDLMGGNIIIIRPGATAGLMENITQTQSYNDYAISTLTEEDTININKIAHIKSTTPLMIMNSTIKADSIAPKNSLVVATNPNLANVSSLTVKDGQFLDETLNKNVVVIGTQLSINIFGTSSSIGRILTIHGESFMVVGVLEQINNPINYNSIDFDNAAIIKLAAGKELNKNVAQIQQINIEIDSKDNIKQAVTDINKTLLSNHGNENDFSILTGNQISQPTSQLFYKITGVITAIAAISLLVGGIGIMNIMLVTVAERTREIGIRKALGASDADISCQFLIESLIIGINGGIAGYIGGYIVAFAISKFLTFDPVVNWQIAGIALFLSLVIGTIFGIYPAIHAARKDPIESLHQYD